MKKICWLFVAVLALSACGSNYMPKPYGYFRVDFPPHAYRTIDTLDLPYRFDISTAARVVRHDRDNERFWIDVVYPGLNASLYCSYKPVQRNLFDLLEDTRKIVYKHTVKADGISEKVFEDRDKHVFGILYDLKGNTASSVQFVLTDSARHFFRAALYFNNVPNKDSIAPMVGYVRQDIVRMIESFEWKSNARK